MHYKEVADETGQLMRPPMGHHVAGPWYDGQPSRRQQPCYPLRPLSGGAVGGGQYRERGKAIGLDQAVVGRGLALGDFNEDGAPDVLVSVNNGRPMLLHNETPKGSHWLAVRARGVKSNRSGIGTRVMVEAGGRRQQGWVRSGSSYGSASDLVAWFGLGAASKAERVTLRWPSGTVQTLTDLPVDREILVEEGKGTVDRASAGTGQ